MWHFLIKTNDSYFMHNIKYLTFYEIAIVRGGNGVDSAERDRALRAARTTYGAQANGFQPNLAAGAVATKSITAGISAVTGIIAGCKPDNHAPF
jgi:hypothetical protein